MWVSKTVTSLWPGAAALKPSPMTTVTDAHRKYKYSHLNLDRHHKEWSGCDFVTQCLFLEAHWLRGDGIDTMGMAVAVMRPVSAGSIHRHSGLTQVDL